MKPVTLEISIAKDGEAMYEVKLQANHLPKIREAGHMKDTEGTLRHPDRTMESINVFFYVKHGAIHVFEKENEYRIQAGGYLFLKNNTPHWGGDFYTPGTEWYYIHFYADPSLDQKDEFSPFHNSPILLDRTYSSQLTFPKSGSVSHRECTEKQLSSMIHALDSPSAFSALQACSLTYQLFIDLYSNAINGQAGTRSSRIISRMIEFLHRNKHAKLVSKDFENELEMNYAYLSSLFKKQTGKSITAYKNELLIAQAIDLFKTSNLNVTEVSSTLGFSNPYYFSRVFKRVTGVAPSVYINELYRNP
ncbi:AraC family transcriptional regulator [Bacillus vallismortis]|nr:AraC family transcriptional regulator [Bacillus vallismortis]MCY8310751.1 AraC family transcriptional regulator [Bacillus vallismortis]